MYNIILIIIILILICLLLNSIKLENFQISDQEYSFAGINCLDPCRINKEQCELSLKTPPIVKPDCENLNYTDTECYFLDSIIAKGDCSGINSDCKFRKTQLYTGGPTVNNYSCTSPNTVVEITEPGSYIFEDKTQGEALLILPIKLSELIAKQQINSFLNDFKPVDGKNDEFLAINRRNEGRRTPWGLFFFIETTTPNSNSGSSDPMSLVTAGKKNNFIIEFFQDENIRVKLRDESKDCLILKEQCESSDYTPDIPSADEIKEMYNQVHNIQSASTTQSF